MMTLMQVPPLWKQQPEAINNVMVVHQEATQAVEHILAMHPGPVLTFRRPGANLKSGPNIVKI